jgi:LuxR family maltose regulon positive regulatory protein
VGEPVQVPGGYRGEAINVAARLCASAGAGEVLASDAVVSLARRVEGLAYDERGPLDLKGIPRPVRAWRVRAEAASGQEEQAASWAASPPVDSLLATKLAIPAVCSCLISRPRLIERLRAGLQGPLTLLSAPAGSGKTTLLSSWRASPEGRNLPLAWVSLDETDNDPTRFWRYVLTALDRAAPGVGSTALALLHASDAPSMEAVLTALLNALTSEARDVVLILDDYHLIEAEPIHRALAFLLAHLPRSLHLLLATRADPPLPLARLRGRGDVTELRIADLNFTVEETAAFLRTIGGLSFSRDEVAALEARTEGWIAGLQLAGLSLQGRSTEEAATFITAFTGSHRYIVDYLLDEVLLRQPEQVQGFLLHTCILDRLCAPLCAALLEGEAPSAKRIGACQEMLESLERNNVFLIALDDDRRWYRYHYLFADALRQRQLGHASIPNVAVLHQRASAWFAQHDLLEEAIDHALAGGCYDQAADLIGRAARALAARGEMQTLSAWLRALPEAALRVRPQLCIMYAWLLVDMRDMEGAEAYLQYAEAALEMVAQPRSTPEGIRVQTQHATANATDMRALIAAGRAVIRAIQGDATGAIAQARAAMDTLDAADVRSRSLATIGLGLAHLSQGAAHEAADAFAEVAVANRATNFGLFMMLAAVGEACAHRMAGDLDQARATYEHAVELSTAHPSLLTGNLHTGLADILRERNALDEALERATHGLAISHDLAATRADRWRVERWIEWHVCNLLALARIKQAQGDLDGALAVAQEAQEHLQGFGATSFAAILTAFEAQLHLAQGNLDAAVQRLRRLQAREAPRFGLTPQYFVYAAEHLELAPIQVLLAQARASDDPTPAHRALLLLDPLRARAERSGLAWLHSKALALQVLAYQVLGDSATALATLERALALAQPEGYMRLFLDEGPPMADLLRRLSARGPAPEPVTALLAALGR